MTTPEKTAAAIKQAALECGYIDCGIASAEPFEEYRQELTRRIHRFPETTDLYQPMFNRADPRRTAPWCSAVVTCVRNYGKYILPGKIARHIGRNYLADRRIPTCPDHTMPKVMTNKLKALGLKAKLGGVPERAAAVRAGVARIGRNGFAFHPEAGSWINLETWRINATPALDTPTPESPCPDKCRRCIESCPTDALQEPCLMRMDRCIAYLTYHIQKPIPGELWNKMGSWIYGCDLCQLYCPLNEGKWRPIEPMPWLEEIKELITPEALAKMEERTYQKYIHPLFWYIPKNQVDRWHRNAARALSLMEKTD